MAQEERVSRRQAVGCVAAALACQPRHVQGQENRRNAEIPAHIASAIELASFEAEDLLTQISTNGDLSVKDATVRIREAQSGIEALLNPDKLQIERSRVSVACLYRHEFHFLNQSYQRFEVSTTTIEEESYAQPAEIEVAEEAEESCWNVILDILLESLGIDKAIRGVVAEVFERFGVDDLASGIAKAAKERNWSKTAQLLRRMLLRIFGRQVVSALERRLERAAMRRFLMAVGSRFVPWVGTAVLVTSLVVAIANNYERFEDCDV